MEPDNIEPISLPTEAQQYLGSNPQAGLFNYDEDWLYIRNNFILCRIRKDGSDYEMLVRSGVDAHYSIDVVDGHVYYRGLDGKFYRDTAAIAEPAPDSPFARRIALEATVIEQSPTMILRPNDDIALARLGEHVRVSLPTRAEIVDDAGQTIQLGDIPIGARITVVYEDTDAVEEYTSLMNMYRIVYHRD